MFQRSWITCIGVTCICAGLLAGAESGMAQTSGGQQNPSSGGTQGLQERLYQERLKELQQSQSGSQSQGKADSPSRRSDSGGAGAPPQSGSNDRQGASSHGSGAAGR